jgi:hypothetical protein
MGGVVSGAEAAVAPGHVVCCMAPHAQHLCGTAGAILLPNLGLGRSPLTVQAPYCAGSGQSLTGSAGLALLLCVISAFTWRQPFILNGSTYHDFCVAVACAQVGFSGGLVVDYPHSTRAKKFFLVLMVGPSSYVPQAKGLDGAGGGKTACVGCCCLCSGLGRGVALGSSWWGQAAMCRRPRG